MGDYRKEVISTAGAPQAIGPYSQGIKVGPFVFLSGQIPLDPRTGKVVEGDIKVQTRQVLDNLKAVLEASGSSLDKVVKTTIFMARIEDYTAINEVYSEYFKDSRPARSAVETSRLPRAVGVEIDAIALAD